MTDLDTAAATVADAAPRFTTTTLPPPPLDGGAGILAWIDGLRAESTGSPVWFNDTIKMWHVFGYDEVHRVVSDTDAFSSDLSPAVPGQLFMDGNFMRMDPPQHRQYRNLINKAFTARTVRDLAPRIEQISDELVTALPLDGPLDFVEHVGFPLPLTVIAELLGVPTGDREMFAGWADELFAADISSPDPDTVAAVEAAAMPMHDYLLAHVRAVRDGRSDLEGMIADVATVELDGEQLSDEEAVTFAALALVAGHITTTSLLGSAVLTLADRPELIADLRADPDRTPAFVQEVLRTRPPFLSVARMATVPVQLAGLDVPAGSLLLASVIGANHDPRQFADPHRFDPARGQAGVTFGHGAHYCLGSYLAQLEADVLLRRLLRDVGEIHLDPDRAPEYFGAQGLLGCRSLSVSMAATPARP